MNHKEHNVREIPSNSGDWEENKRIAFPVTAAIRKRCVVALLVFLTLGLANFYLQEQLFKKNQADNKTISIVNGQLALIQQGFFLSEQLIDSASSETRENIRGKLKKAATQIERNNADLFQGKRQVLPEVRTLYYRKPVFLQKRLKSYLSCITALLEEPDRHLNRQNSIFKELHAGGKEKQFEDIFHSLNRILQEESRQSNIRMQPLGYLLLLMNIAMLAATWFFIFFPMIQYIRAKQEEDLLIRQTLANKNRQLEETHGQLTEELAKRTKAEAELLQVNDELESKVESRTEQLSTLNDRLQEELSQRKTLESQLIQAQKMESIGQLAAGVAHEINNPIGFVKSNLSTLEDYVLAFKTTIENYRTLDGWLREQGNEPLVAGIMAKNDALSSKEDLPFILEDATSLIEESQDGIRRVQDIVRGLKTFARIDEDTLQEADINVCLESTLRIIWNEVKYKCTVDKQLGSLPHIHCFPSQLNQVFMNLIVNASQAIETKGKIGIKTSATESEVHVEISDSGMGISKENQAKIFDPFFTTKPIGKGTGLGLSISYGIIRKHKGHIEIDSEEGVGTTFRIILPILDKDELLAGNEATDGD